VINLDSSLNFAFSLIKENKFTQVKEYLLKDFKEKKDHIYFYCLAFAEFETGNIDIAIKHYETSIALKKDFYESYLNLAVLLFRKKRKIEAKKILIDILEKEKKNFFLLYNLGLFYFEDNEFPEALNLFKQCVEINNSFYEGYHYLGMVYEKLGDNKRALENYLTAQNLNKEKNCQTMNNIGALLTKQNKLEEASKAFNFALTLDGDKRDLFFNLGAYYFEIAEPEKGIEFLIKSNENNFKHRFLEKLLGGLHYVQYEDDKKKKWIKAYVQTIYREKSFHHKRKIDTNKISIGFLSGDFRNHPVGYYTISILKNLNSETFLSYLYSNNEYEDETSHIIKKYCTKWNSVRILSNDELLDKICEDKIDILIDLSGHTEMNRLSVFACKPAPIQLSWAGYLASTYVPELDYILGDPYVLKDNFQNNYSEKIYMLPNTWCVLSNYQIRDLQIEDTPCIKNNYITFGSLNNLNKINSEVIKTWCSILQKVNNSRILIKNFQLNHKLVKDNLLSKFLENNINQDRVLLLGSSERLDNIKTYNQIDIALDPFPYNGGTTNFEASWMGVPIVTLRGKSFVSCCGESINKNLNMEKLIANNLGDYINISSELGNNLGNLMETRKFLRENSRGSIIFNDITFTKQFENAMVDMCNIFNQKIN